MKVQTVGESPTTIEVEDNGDGTYTDADGTTYALQHNVGPLTFVAKAEALIDKVEDAIAGELPVEETPAEEPSDNGDGGGGGKGQVVS